MPSGKVDRLVTRCRCLGSAYAPGAAAIASAKARAAATDASRRRHLGPRMSMHSVVCFNASYGYAYCAATRITDAVSGSKNEARGARAVEEMAGWKETREPKMAGMMMEGPAQ